MDDETFVNTVATEAGVDWEEAERATRAVLQTVGERIAGGEARDLAAQLPPGIAPWIGKVGDAEGFGVDEFLRRVAEREGVDVETAERHARAVFTALGRAVTRDEIADLKAQLSEDYEPLVAAAEGRVLELVPTEEFLRKVADRAGTDEEGARRATEAVLEVLAQRIAGGEVDDLIARLPAPLHPPLERGKDKSGGAATRMRVGVFVERVAEVEGVPLEQAVEHARAVLVTLREAVGEDEFRDIDDELPAEYDPLLAR
jgi:uncharacterized protein (DUF2267 family)